MAETNPNGANQYKRDPRQRAFKRAYCNPNSPTFGNAYQSALGAGYKEEYAKVITTQDYGWFSEMLRDMDLLDKAEEVLKETLEMSDEEAVIFDGVPLEDVTRRNPALTKIKQDSAKFVAERLGKERYSLRNEITGEDGEPISWRVVRGKSEEPDVKGE